MKTRVSSAIQLHREIMEGAPLLVKLILDLNALALEEDKLVLPYVEIPASLPLHMRNVMMVTLNQVMGAPVWQKRIKVQPSVQRLMKAGSAPL